ncbi:hypothetical protein AB0M36_17195 [Actinoplanes sp. NPDC051346]|uniref:hypothetical protein n=1 Tax=Actinoplanes sp. NPDC051346 TaxID=3155048 RepID=UPI0034414559
MRFSKVRLEPAYKPDGGTSWQVVAVDITGSSVSVPRWSLPGSTTAKLKVIASDGIRSTAAASETFSLRQGRKHRPAQVVDLRSGRQRRHHQIGQVPERRRELQDGQVRPALTPQRADSQDMGGNQPGLSDHPGRRVHARTAVHPEMSRPRPRPAVAVRAAGMLLLAPLLPACTPTAEPSTGDNGLTGTAVVLDDTGLSDSPIEEGWIIAVPEAAVDDLWSAAGVAPPEDMPHANIPLSRDQVTRAGGVIAPLDREGRFALPAKEGGYLLCRLKQTESGGERTRGCGVLTLPAAGKLRITDGEGGFHAVLKE